MCDECIELACEAPVRFACVWFVSFLVLFSTFFVIGFVPDAFAGKETEENNTESVLPQETDDTDVVFIEEQYVGDAGADAPVRVIIDAIGVDTEIANPQSTDIAVLDEALNDGAVRYPGSGNLEDTSNMFLFGHSSHLPSVINPAYQAFNGLEDLENGDIIRVLSNTKEYIYRVDTVELVQADEAWVELSNTEKKLTLSTCNNFGSKQDRFVVEASFLGSYEL